MTPRIYLDNAATSWPKPEGVYAAVDDYQRRLGAAAGRGAYREAGEVERLVADARSQVAKLIGCRDARRIIFGFNGTDVLNTALHGAIRNGDHVVTTAAEHNSVLRPLRWLAEHRNVAVTYVPCNATGMVDPDEVAAAIQHNTRLVAVVHASNVTGALQPVAEIADAAHNKGVLLLVDAAQSLGHVPIDVCQLPIDLLAAPGHKGLMGQLGTGVLYIAPGVEDQVESFRQGGTGTQSDDDVQPQSLPDKYESGNHNVPGLVGLGAAVAFLQDRGVEQVRQHEQQLTARLIAGLNELEGVSLYGPNDPEQQVGVVSFNLDDFAPQEVAGMLDASHQIQSRAGFHCAPRMHQALGTAERGGTVRLSVGLFNSPEEIDTALRAIADLASMAASG